MEYKLITCIVEKGKSQHIIDEALRKGAQAATFFEAKGRGVRERIGVSGMFIKEDKEVILIVTRQKETRLIFDTVVSLGGLKEKGLGFAYIQPVEDTMGFLD
ncbi:MAG: hypothetical protein JW803_09445 [Endomicrobiales bacterium]|nr:hypothetical protein [Endomicrobiales bacterium]